MFNFVIKDCSRVFTAENNRHRVGIAISEQSQRYVRLRNVEIIRDPILDDPVPSKIIDEVEEFLTKKYTELVEHFNLDNEPDFNKKKKATSAIRRILPQGIGTIIGWSANIRTLRHCIEMRTSRHAEFEIRYVFNQIAEIMKKEVPACFSDYTVEIVDGLGEWTTPNRKI